MSFFLTVETTPIVVTEGFTLHPAKKALVSLLGKEDRNTPENRKRAKGLLETIMKDLGDYEHRKMGGTIMLVDKSPFEELLLNDRWAYLAAETPTQRAEGLGNIGADLIELEDWSGGFAAGERSISFGNTPSGWTAYVSGLAGLGEYERAGKAFLEAYGMGGSVRNGLLQTVTTPGHALFRHRSKISAVKKLLRAHGL